MNTKQQKGNDMTKRKTVPVRGPMTAIIEQSGGDLNKAIRPFNRMHGDPPRDDKQFAADLFNGAWCELVPERPLKIARGCLVRLFRSGQIPQPAGHRVPPEFAAMHAARGRSSAR
jgi:hypothetical protein